jgi:hypothetical protein
VRVASLKSVQRALCRVPSQEEPVYDGGQMGEEKEEEEEEEEIAGDGAKKYCGRNG